MQSSMSIPSDVNLNDYKHQTSFNHSLVLLEGNVFKSEQKEGISYEEHGIILKGQDSDKEHSGASQHNLSNIQQMHIVINHNGSCQPWPVVEGNFKAFVKLTKGVNEVEILCPKLQSRQSLTLIRTKPENQPRFVRVVYIKCSDSDGKFDSPENSNNDLNMAIQKLRFNALLLQSFTAVDMYKHGFGFQTFQLEEDEKGEVMVHVFVSKLTTEKAHCMTGSQLYDWFHSELTHSCLYDTNCKFLSFMSCTHYDPPDEMDVKNITKYVKAHTALGGGHLGLFGTGGLHTWASDVEDLVKCFTDTTKIDKTKLFDDSARRGTYWANYSTTLGAAIHELGHCFDLAHTPDGIMGRGFDDMNCFATVTSKEKSIPTTTECGAVETKGDGGTQRTIEEPNNGTQPCTIGPPIDGIEDMRDSPRGGSQLAIGSPIDGTESTTESPSDGTPLTLCSPNGGTPVTTVDFINDCPGFTTDPPNHGTQFTVNHNTGCSTEITSTSTETVTVCTSTEITTEMVNGDGTDMTTVTTVVNHNTENTTETSHTSSETVTWMVNDEFTVGNGGFTTESCGGELAPFTEALNTGTELARDSPNDSNLTAYNPCTELPTVTDAPCAGNDPTTPDDGTTHTIMVATDGTSTEQVVNRGPDHTTEDSHAGTRDTSVTNGASGLTQAKSTNMVPSTELVHASTDLITEIFNDHRAHWYRSSAVILHYHKWFTSHSSPTEEDQLVLQVNWSPNVKGPVGNGGGGQSKQTFFDDLEWCKKYGLVIAGYAVYHGKYIHALEPLTTTQPESKLEESPIRGKVDNSCSLSIFLMEEGEYLTSIEARTGAWLDGIRFHTNIKSSEWFGGRGGNWNHLKPSNGERITGIFGSFKTYVGSLGIHVGERSPLDETKDDLQIESNHGIRLVEIRKGDEMAKFWEFTHCNPPTIFHVPSEWWKTQDDLENCSIFVVDNQGNICDSGFLGYKHFVRKTEEVIEEKEA